jgi:hypothetical protein
MSASSPILGETVMSIDLQALSLRFKDTFSEMLEVVRTIEVEMDENTYRIDIVCGIGGAGTFYNARYFIERTFILQPESYSDEKGTRSEPERASVWVDCQCGWVHAQDPDVAVAQALGFLAEGKKRS